MKDQQMYEKRHPILSIENELGGVDYTVNILNEILGPDTFTEVIQALNTASEVDRVIFKINSPGGRLDTTVMLIDAIKRTEAQTLADCAGVIASAATAIALSCDGLYIAPYSEFMSHHFSGGIVGKGHEIEDYVEFELPNKKYFVRSIYKNFLSKKEIKRLIHGKDIYLNPEQVYERWENVLEARRKEYEKQVKRQEKEQVEAMTTALVERGYVVTKE